MLRLATPLLALLCPLMAFADPDPEPDLPETSALEDELAGVRGQLTALQGELESARSNGDHAASVITLLESLIAHGAVLLDERRSSQERSEAAYALADLQDLRALAFLRAAVRDRVPEVQHASMAAASAFRSSESVVLAEWVLRDYASMLQNRREAIDLLVALGLPEAGQLLWEVSGDRTVPTSLRTEARKALETAYPEVLQANGEPSVVSDPLGAVAGITANGIVGGTLLSSVGTWGQFDAGVTIGAVGGSLIGLGTGTLYAMNRPITSGEGLTYASGVGWGLTVGVMASNATFGPELYAPWNTFQRNRNDVSALYRVAGVSAGAGLGLLAMRSSPDPTDVLEVDLAAYLGSQVAMGTVGLTYQPRHDSWSDSGRQYRQRHSQIKSGVGLAGTLGGLGVGLALHKRWKLDVQDVLFATAIGAEAAWIGGWMPTALGLRYQDVHGNIQTPLHVSMIGALALAEVRPFRARDTALGSYGAVMGNALGAGIPLSLNVQDDATVARAMLPVGAIGMAAGLLGAPWLNPSAGDWAMVGVGVPIAVAEATAIGAVLEKRGVVDPSQIAGFASTAAGVSGAGLMVLGHYVEPDPADMIFLGSAGMWGTWFGLMTPYALRLDLFFDTHVLTTTITADAFLIGGGLAVSPLMGLEPKDTLLAQLGGVSGATLGALGASLFAPDGESVAMGAVIGSLTGIGAGAVTTWVLRSRDKELAVRVPLPLKKLPGQWTPVVAPTVIDEKYPGVSVGFRVDGW